jgi:hypothetical protein
MMRLPSSSPAVYTLGSLASTGNRECFRLTVTRCTTSVLQTLLSVAGSIHIPASEIRPNYPSPTQSCKCTFSRKLPRGERCVCAVLPKASCAPPSLSDRPCIPCDADGPSLSWKSARRLSPSLPTACSCAMSVHISERQTPAHLSVSLHDSAPFRGSVLGSGGTYAFP